MTNEELVLMVQAGEDRAGNIERLYLQNKGLIASIAARYVGYEDHEDLMQEGFLALLKAARLWKPDGGANFATYAARWMKATMREYIDNFGSVVRVPRYRTERVIQYKKALSRFRALFARDPTAAELAELLDLQAVQVEEIRKDAAALSPRSMEEPAGFSDDGARTLGETIASPADEIGEVIEEADRESLARLLWGLVDELEAAEAAIIRKQYKEGRALPECGAALGMTLNEARKTQARALRKLRRASVKKALQPYADEIMTEHAYSGTGLTSFRRTWTSAQEKIAIMLEEKEAALKRRA